MVNGTFIPVQDIVSKGPKFKVGDEVECIEGATSHSGPGSGWKLGYRFIVEKITFVDSGRPIYWKGLEGHGVYEDYLKLVAEEALITVGSIIKLKEYESYSDYTRHMGEQAKVVEIGGYPPLSYGIQWSDGSSSSVSRENIIIVKGGLRCKNFIVGDVITYEKGSDAFEGEGQIVFNDGLYYHIRLVEGTGGGLLLADGKTCWKVRAVNRLNLKRKRRRKIIVGLSERVGELFRYNEEIYIKDRHLVGKIYDIGYNAGIPRYTIEYYPKRRYVLVNSQDIERATDELKAEACYRCLVKKLSRERPGTEEENKKIRPGCAVEIRNMEENEDNGWEIGRRYIVIPTKYGNSSGSCYINKGGLGNTYDVDKSRVRFVEDLSVKFKFKISATVANSFYGYRGEKSPLVLLGANKKGVVDISIMSSDMSGCDELAGMSPNVFANTLRTLILTKREWVGYGIIYAGRDRAPTFWGLGLRFIERDKNLSRVYVCILPQKGIYPYRLVKYAGQLQFLPMQLQVVP